MQKDRLLRQVQSEAVTPFFQERPSLLDGLLYASGDAVLGINPASDPSPIGRFGNSGVGILEGPGTINLSMGLGKSFHLTERLVAKIEGSFTNLPNHTNLGDPRLNLTSSSFGRITAERSSEFGGHRTGQVGVRIEF